MLLLKNHNLILLIGESTIIINKSHNIYEKSGIGFWKHDSIIQTCYFSQNVVEDVKFSHLNED